MGDDERGYTFFFVNTEHNDDLIATETNELLHRPDTPPRQFRQKDHSLNVVVFELLTEAR